MSSIIPPPRPVKVGLDPKKPIQAVQTYDTKRAVVINRITAYWLVQWSGKQPDPTACYGATDGKRTLPVVTQGYTSNAGERRICYQVMPQLVPDSYENLYRCQVDYTDEPQTYSGKTGKWEVGLSIDGVPVTESYFYDLDGYPVLNSCQQQYTQQPSKPYTEEQIEVSFKTDSWDEVDAEGLQTQLNNSSITLSVSSLKYTRTFPAGTLRFNKCRSSTTLQAGQLAYWTVALDLTYRALVTAPPNCKTKGGTNLGGTQVSTLEYDFLVDQGYSYYDSGNSNKLTTFCNVDANNNSTPANEPHLLDGTGHPVQANGSTSGPPAPSATFFFAHRKANRGNIAALLSGIA